MIFNIKCHSFIYTPKLKIINFASNNIKRIGSNLFKPLKNLEYIWFEKNSCIDRNSRNFELKSLRKEIKSRCRAGGTECQKIPRVLTRWNVTKPVEACEVVQVYRFKPKPRHELERFEREKAAKAQKDREDHMNNDLKISEFPDTIYRFFETVYHEDTRNVKDKDIKWAIEQKIEKKITDSLVSVAAKNAEK